MSLLGQFFDYFWRVRKGNTAAGPSYVMPMAGVGAVGDITAMQAQTIAAVYCAIAAYTNAISPLDITILDRATDKPVTDHPLTGLLASELNTEQTNQQIIAYLVGSLFTRGNAYAQVRRTNGAKVVEIVPLDPDLVRAIRKGGKIVYKISKGKDDETPDELAAADVIHVHLNYRPKELAGMSPIAFARNSIALGMALDQFGLSFFANGANTRNILEAPPGTTPEQAKQISDTFNANSAGMENAHKTGVLAGGVKLHQLTLNPDDCQFLESRKFTVNEVARWFNLPPSRIGGDRASGTYSNLTMDQAAFVLHSITPVCEMFAQEMARKLLTPAERAKYYLGFDLSELMEGLTALTSPTAPAPADKGDENA